MSEAAPDNASDNPADWGEDHPAFQMAQAILGENADASPEDIDNAAIAAAAAQARATEDHGDAVDEEALAQALALLDPDNDAGGDGGEKPDAGADANAKPDDAGDKPDAGGDGGADDKGADNPEGVLTKDGQRFLPYSTLESTRAQLDAQRQENARLRDELAGKAPTAPPPDSGMSDEDRQAKLESIKEQFGEDAAALFEDTHAKTAAVQAENEALKRQLSAQDDRTVEQVIAGKPALVALQAEGGENWKRFLDMNRGFMQTETIASLPIGERFDMAIAALGIADPSKPADVKPDTKDDAAAEAARKAAEAADTATDAPPKSLSDLSGGNAPENTQSPLEQMGFGDLHDRMAGLDTDDLVEFLRRVDEAA